MSKKDTNLKYKNYETQSLSDNEYNFSTQNIRFSKTELYLMLLACLPKLKEEDHSIIFETILDRFCKIKRRRIWELPLSIYNKLRKGVKKIRDRGELPQFSTEFKFQRKYKPQSLINQENSEFSEDLFQSHINTNLEDI